MGGRSAQVDLRTIKKQKGIYTGAVEVTLASSPARPGAGKAAGGLAGWAGAAVVRRTVFWFVDTPSQWGGAHRLTLRNG